MKNMFTEGDVKIYTRIINSKDIARFESGTVHEVYATFAIARDAEWSSRLFVLDMKDEDEEGIGTMVEIKHLSPAFPGDEVTFIAEIYQIKGNEIICTFEAKVQDRLIAKGKTGQKILKKEKLNKLFSGLKNEK